MNLYHQKPSIPVLYCFTSLICKAIPVCSYFQRISSTCCLCSSLQYYANHRMAAISLCCFHLYIADIYLSPKMTSYFQSTHIRAVNKNALLALWLIDPVHFHSKCVIYYTEFWNMRGGWHTLINMQSMLVFQFKFCFTDESFSHCNFVCFYL